MGLPSRKFHKKNPPEVFRGASFFKLANYGDHYCVARGFGLGGCVYASDSYTIFLTPVA